jgi:hypothetical protein
LCPCKRAVGPSATRTRPPACERRGERTLGALAPRDRPPRPALQHRLGRNGLGGGNRRLPRSTAFGHRTDHHDLAREHLLDPWDACRPDKLSRRERLTKGGADPIAGVGEHGAEADAERADPVELLERQIRLGQPSPPVLGYARRVAARRVVDPLLGQKQAQHDRDRHLVPGQGERDENLTVGTLAEAAAVLARHSDRMHALLGQGGVVDHQHGVWPAKQAVGLPDQLVLERAGEPRRGRDEAVPRRVV